MQFIQPSDLPSEIWLHIAIFISTRDLSNFFRVNSKFLSINNDNVFWLRRLARQNPKLYISNIVKPSLFYQLIHTGILRVIPVFNDHNKLLSNIAIGNISTFSQLLDDILHIYKPSNNMTISFRPVTFPCSEMPYTLIYPDDTSRHGAHELSSLPINGDSNIGTSCDMIHLNEDPAFIQFVRKHRCNFCGSNFISYINEEYQYYCYDCKKSNYR